MSFSPDAATSQVESLFQAVADLPREQRSSYLDAHAGNDPVVRGEVERLLALLDDDKQTQFLESPVFCGSPARDAATMPEIPARIGHYRILRLIGAGGMGVVYEAEQDNPRRTVALKVIRSGVLTPTLLKRFEREAQLLGQLRHPGIARIYEAGSVGAEGGQTPYFAMELIVGATLTEYSRSRALGTAEKLELMARVCDAVAHAHAKGIVHRDLKPGNILVEEDDSRDNSVPAVSESPSLPRGTPAAGVAWPKILDFGVARVATTDVQTLTLQTDAGQLVGTIPYMSPEQVTGDPHAVDARSDVYSLGVVLFELLAGRLPHDVRGRSIPDAARMIREDEPTRLGSIVPAMRGELETIIDKALEKDPARRYTTAAALGEDLRRFLRDEPIIARPASALYQFRKFARRHKAWVAGTVALALGCAGALVFAVRANRERQRAEQKSSEAERLAYQVSLSAAQAALSGRNAVVARGTLDAAPAALRGWEWNHLHYLTDRSRCTMTAAAGGLPFVALCPAGEFLLTVQADSMLRLWSIDGCQLARSIDAGEGEFDGIAVRPGHMQAVCSEKSGAVSLRDLQTGKALWRIPGRYVIDREAFANDGRLLVMARANSPSLQFVDADTGKVVSETRIESPVARAVSFSRDGRRVACDPDMGTRVFDVTPTANNGVSLRLAWHREDSAIPRFSGDGKHLVCWAGLSPGLFDAATGREIRRYHPVGRSFGDIAISPNGAYVAASDADGLVALYDVSEQASMVTLCSHSSSVRFLAFTADSLSLITGSGDGVIKLWDSALGPVPPRIDTTNDTCADAAPSPDGRFYALAGAGQLQLMDADTGEELWSVMLSRRMTGAVAYSPDGARIAAGSDDGNVYVVHANSGRLLQSISVGEQVTALAASADGTRWIIGGPRQARVLDAAGDQPAATPLGTSGGNVYDVAVDASTGRIATASEDGRVRLFDGHGNAATAELPGPGGALTCLVFSADGRMLCAAGAQAIRLWRCEDWSIARDIPVSTLTSSLAFHPDGRRVAGVQRDRAVRIWSIQTGDVLATFRATPLMQHEMSFSPDGRTLRVPGFELRLWLLECAPLPPEKLARRELMRRARLLIDPMTRERMLTVDIIDRLKTYADADPAVLDAAKRMALARGDHINWQNSDAWGVARYAGKTPEQYAMAKRKIDTACARWPDDWGFLNTRGLVEYRLGEYETALQTLLKADEVRRRAQQSHPLDIAFMAMCRRRLGDMEGARRDLAESRRLQALPEYAGDEESRELVAQAATVVESP